MDPAPASGSQHHIRKPEEAGEYYSSELVSLSFLCVSKLLEVTKLQITNHLALWQWRESHTWLAML